MRFRGLFIICIIISSLSAFIVSPVEGASESFVEGPHEFYIVKEVIEVTSDWQDITWTQGPEVYSIRYTVVEGAEAIEDIEVSGLTVWVTQKSLDTVKVVLEIEALVLKGDETAQVSVRKGAIGYANVELMVYDASSGSFSGVTEFHSSMESLDFEFDASSIYAEPASELVLEETLKELKGKVLSFYYPWYSNPLGPTNEWCHWEGVTEDSISSSVNYPLLGAYDSNDEDVIRSHMAIAKQAGIDGFIVSWWGIRTHDAKPVDEILELAEEMDLNITFYYESVRDLTEDEIARELAYLIESYADHPAFLMVSGKPVVFVYAVPVYDREAEFWLDVRGRLEENVGPVVLIGDTDSEEFINAFDGFHTYLYTEELARDMETDIPVFFRESVDRFEVGVSTMDTDDLFSAAYSGEDIEMRVKTFLITVTPQIGIGGPDMYKERDSTTYERYWDIVEEIGPHSILITSWNEWHEGTEIEPSREYGFEYINATRRFIEEYKGTPIPEPEVTYTAVVEPFKQNADLTGSGVIMISANGAPALYVNVSVSGDAGVTSLGLEGEFITYVSEQRDNYTSIIIPSVSQQDGQEVEVVFEAESPNPTFSVSITALDPTGRSYELFWGEVSSFAKGSITASASRTREYGESIIIFGRLSPEGEGNEVNLIFTRPDSTNSIRTAVTAYDGSYTDSLELDMVGAWEVEASWDGDEDFEGATSKIIEFVVQKALTDLSLQASAPSVTEGQTLTISGSLEPVVQSVDISIVYTKPDGTMLRRTAVTNSEGEFSNSTTPTETGSWTARATWEGDLTHLEATSGEVTIQVNEKKGLGQIPGFPLESLLLSLVMATLILLGKNLAHEKVYA